MHWHIKGIVVIIKLLKVLDKWGGQRSTNGHLHHIKGTTKGCIDQAQNLISIDPGVWPEKP